MVRTLLLVLVRCFSYTPDASFNEDLLLYPHANFSLRHASFCDELYAPNTSLSEEFLLHTPWYV